MERIELNNDLDEMCLTFQHFLMRRTILINSVNMVKSQPQAFKNGENSSRQIQNVINYKNEIERIATELDDTNRVIEDIERHVIELLNFAGVPPGVKFFVDIPHGDKRILELWFDEDDNLNCVGPISMA